MANTEQKKKQIAYMNQYNRENYDRYTVMLPKGTKQIYRELAEHRGHTLNGLINALLDAELKKYPIDIQINQ